MNAWVMRESRTRPASAQLGFRLLRAFMNWCAEHPDYRSLVNADACKSKKTREKLGKPKAKNDSLQREQLRAWFAEVRRDPNPVASAYLQALLITGARREELMSLRWDDVDFQWKAIRLRDKVEGERTIPLTPYVAHLLSWLPRRGPWVFSSPQAKSGRLQEPRPNHVRALDAAGLPHLTLARPASIFRHAVRMGRGARGHRRSDSGRTSQARLPRSTTACARSTCCACGTSESRSGFLSRPA